MNSVVPLSEDTFPDLKQLLHTEFGVVVAQECELHITEKLNSVMRKKGIGSMGELSDNLRKNNSHELRSDVLLAITEHNIDWYHYPDIMSVFNNYILPNISKNRIEPYRIWVVGCGKGQMALSLAIDTDRFKKKKDLDFLVEIVATDSSEATVENAKKVIFKESSLAGLSEMEIKKYLTRTGDQWRVNDAIASMVTFTQANLLDIDQQKMSGFDLIICPDVLAYFMVNAKSEVLDMFEQSLNNAGILLAEAFEPILPFCKKFTLVEHDSGVFYRK